MEAVLGVVIGFPPFDSHCSHVVFSSGFEPVTMASDMIVERVAFVVEADDAVE